MHWDITGRKSNSNIFFSMPVFVSKENKRRLLQWVMYYKFNDRCEIIAIKIGTLSISLYEKRH